MVAVEQITTIRSSLDPSGIQKGMQAAVSYVREGATIIAKDSGDILAATAKLAREWVNAADKAQKLVNVIDGQNAALARYTGAFKTMEMGVRLGAVQIGVAEKTLESFTQKLGLSSAMLGANNSIGLTLEQNFKRLVGIFDPVGTAAIKMATAITDLKQAQAAGVSIMGGYQGALERIQTAYAEASIAGIGFSNQAKESLITINAQIAGAKSLAAAMLEAGRAATLAAVSQQRNSAALAEYAIAQQAASGREARGQQITGAFNDSNAERASVDALYRSSVAYEAELAKIINLKDTYAISSEQELVLIDQLNARYSAQTGTVAELTQRNREAAESALVLAEATKQAGLAATQAAIANGRNSQALAEYAMALRAANEHDARGQQIAGAFNDSNAERASVDALYRSSVAYEAELAKIINLKDTYAISSEQELVLIDQLNARYSAQTGTVAELTQRNREAAESALALAEATRQAGIAATEAAVANGRNSAALQAYAEAQRASSAYNVRGQQIAGAFNDSNAERASVDALYRSSVAYEQEYNKIINLRKTGAIGEALENSLLDQANARFAGLGTSVKGANDHLRVTGALSSGVTRELIVLGHEMVTGNFSRFGGSILVMTEYMTQMGGAVGEVIKSIFAFIFSWKGLAVLSAAALVAGLALVANAAQSAAVRVGELRNVLSASRSDFVEAADAAERAARSVARLNPISTADARASANAISANGFTGTQEQLERLVVLSAKLSAQLGETAVNAKRAGEIVANPSGVLAEILKASNNNAAFDQNLVTQVKHLQESGKMSEALILTFKALSDQTAHVQLKVSDLGQAWMDLGKAFNSADTGQKTLAERMGGPVLSAVVAVVQGVTWLVNKLKDLEAVFPELARTLVLVFTFGPLGFIIDKVVTLINLVKGLSSDPAVQAAAARSSGSGIGEGLLKAGATAALPGVGTAVALIPDSAMVAFWSDATQHSTDFWKFAKDTMTKSSGDTWHDIYNVFITTVLTPFELILSGLRLVVDGFKAIISYFPGGGSTSSSAGSGLAPYPKDFTVDRQPLSASAGDVQSFITAFLQSQTQIKLNDAAIGAILANIQGESSFNPTAWNKAHTDYGLFGYSSTGGRLQDMQRVTGSQEPNALEQLRYFINEITAGAYSNVGRNLSQLPNTLEGAQAGTGMFTRLFENPKNADQVALARAQNAAQFLPPGLTTMAGAVGGPLGTMTPTQVISAADELAKASAVQRLAEATKNETIAQKALDIENAKPQPDPKLVAQYTEVLDTATKAKYEAVTAAQAVFRAIEIEITGQTKLSLAAREGAISESNMTIRLKAEAEARRLVGGVGEQYVALSDILTERYKKEAIALESVPLAKSTRDLQNQIDVMKVENDTIGLDVNARALLVAMIKQDQALQKAYPQQYAANTAAIQEQRTKMVELTLQTQAQQKTMMNLNEAANFVDQTFTTLGTSFVDAFYNGKTAAINFKDTMVTISKAILNEFVKLFVIAPLMNSLFPSTTQRATGLGVIDALGANSGSGGSVGAGGSSALSLLSTGGSLASGGSSLLQALGYQGLGGQINGLFGGPGTSLLAGLGGSGTSGLSSAVTGLLNTQLLGGTANFAMAADGTIPALSGGLTLGGALGGVGGGFALGSLSGKLIQGALNKEGPAPIIGAGIGAVGGAVVGATALSELGPAGVLIGGIIGGLLGGSAGGFIGPHPANAFSGTAVSLQDGQLSVGASVQQRDPSTGPGTTSDAATINAFLASNGLKLTSIAPLAQIGQNTPGGFQDPTKFADLASAFPNFGFSSASDPTLSKFLTDRRYADMESLQTDITNYHDLVVSTIPALTAETKATGTLNDAITQINAAFNPAIAAAESFGVATDTLTAAQTKAIDAAKVAADKVLVDASTAANNRYLAAFAQITGSPADALKASLASFDTQAQQQRDALSAQIVAIYGDAVKTTEGYAARMGDLEKALGEERLTIQKSYDDQVAKTAKDAADAAAAANAAQAAEVARIIAAQRQAANADQALNVRIATAGGQLSGDPNQQYQAQLLGFDAQAQQERDSLSSQLIGTFGAAYQMTKEYTDHMVLLDQALAAERAVLVKSGSAQVVSTAQTAFTNAQNALASALNEQLSLTQTQISATQSNSDALHKLAESLHAFIANLSLGASSPLSPADKLAAAQSQFAIDTNKARTTGDPNAVSAAQTDASTVLDLAQNYYGKSTTAYQQVFNETTSALTMIENGLNEQASLADQTLATLHSQYDLQKQQLDVARAVGQQTVNSVDVLSTTMATSFAALQAALLAAANPVAGHVSGGWVGNGLWNRDSVLARFAGGGNIALAGGEFVMSAPAAALYSDVLPLMNSGRLGRGSNDNVSNDTSGLVAEVRGLRAQVATLTRAVVASGTGQIEELRTGNDLHRDTATTVKLAGVR